MTDKDLYQKIGQILFNEAPNVDHDIHFLVHINGDWLPGCCWLDCQPRGQAFAISADSAHKIEEYTILLNNYFNEHNMGEWNVLHFSITPQTGKFNVDFDFNEGLENKNISFSKYAESIHCINS